MSPFFWSNVYRQRCTEVMTPQQRSWGRRWHRSCAPWIFPNCFAQSLSLRPLIELVVLLSEDSACPWPSWNMVDPWILEVWRTVWAGLSASHALLSPVEKRWSTFFFFSFLIKIFYFYWSIVGFTHVLLTLVHHVALGAESSIKICSPSFTPQFIGTVSSYWPTARL